MVIGIMMETLPNTTPKDLALTKSGITRERNYKSISSHLEAVIDEGSMKDGVWVPKLVPNYPVQEKAQEKILRIMGDIKTNEASVTNTQINITATSQEIKDLIEFVNSRRVRDNRREQTGEVIDVGSYRAR